MDYRSYASHVIGFEFGLNPYEIEDTWSEFQIAQTTAFLREHLKNRLR